MINIKPLTEMTYQQWLPLWQGYLDFYQSILSDEVKQNTWAKLTDPNQSHIYGFVACIDEAIIGLVHVIEHVYRVAAQRQCDRVIWLTQQSNHVAQALYQQVATQTGFIQYKKSLNTDKS